MKQFKLSFLLIMLMSIASTKASAYDFEVDGKYYNIISIENLTCEITYKDYVNYSGDIVIPSLVVYNNRTLKVIRIGDDAFNGDRITSISIPNTIKTIGKSAFKGSSLSSITLPNSITTIGTNAFENCMFSSVTIPNSVTSIGYMAFKNCTNLEQIVLPPNITAISQELFMGCTSLSQINVPNKVVTIYSSAFRGCTSLTSVNLPEGLETIKESAFRECSSLRSIIIPSTCNLIENYTFNGCPIQVLTIKDGTTPISLGFSKNEYRSYWGQAVCRDLFYTLYNSSYEYYCPIRKVYLGRIARRASELAANENYHLEYDYGLFGYNVYTLIIGNMVTDEVFTSAAIDLFLESPDGRTNYVRYLTLGKNINTVPNFSFNSQLNEIIVLNENPPIAKGFANSTYLNCKLYVPYGTKSIYQSADIWKNFWNIVELDAISEIIPLEQEKYKVNHYSLDGMKLKEPRKGINIIKMSDGTTRKVIVK